MLRARFYQALLWTSLLASAHAYALVCPEFFLRLAPRSWQWKATRPSDSSVPSKDWKVMADFLAARGIGREDYVYRVVPVSKDYLEVGPDGQLLLTPAPAGKGLAVVRDIYAADARKIGAAQLGRPTLNVAGTQEAAESYAESGNVLVKVRVRDLLDSGALAYPDVGTRSGDGLVFSLPPGVKVKAFVQTPINPARLSSFDIESLKGELNAVTMTRDEYMRREKEGTLPQGVMIRLSN